MTFTGRWLGLFAAGAIVALAAALDPVFIGVTAAWYILLALLAAADWTLSARRVGVGVSRRAADRLARGEASPVVLSVRNSSRARARLQILDTPPLEFATDLPDTPVDVRLEPGRSATLTYQVTPAARGRFRFGNLFVRVLGPLGCVRRQLAIPAAHTVKVYPNLVETARFDLAAHRGRLQQIGIRAARMHGAGREFESLRDYQPDDELRRIDWKATARRGKLVSREYEVEKSQSIILALNLGRTMLAEIDGVQKLDYAVDAALLLAYVAAVAEDRVGLLLFAGSVRLYLPPKRGRSNVYRMLEALHDASATLEEPDYGRAFTYLRARWRRRSLVVCFTDLWDVESSRQTIEQLASLQPHHLVAAVTLLDTGILRAAEQRVTTADSVFQKAAALAMLDDRRAAVAALSDRGVLVVDSRAERLSADLVNRYLQVKERMML